MPGLFLWFGIIFFGLILLSMAVKITREYERGVIFRLGRFTGVRGPGLFLLIPFIDKMERVELRTVTMDIPEQDVITKDNVSVLVDAVLYFKIFDPEKAIIQIQDFVKATSQIAQTTIRSIVGKSTLDEILGERERINEALHKIIDEATNPWGIKVSIVEVKHVEIPKDMQRAIAREAEAERVRRAKILLAQGEFQAAGKLKEAGKILGTEPIHLRYLETLSEIAKEQNTTIVIPSEMIGWLQKLKAKGKV